MKRSTNIAATVGVALYGKVLNLAFDVDFAEGFASRAFEDRTCFSGEKPETAVFLFEKTLSFVIVDELRSIAVGLES